MADDQAAPAEAPDAAAPSDADEVHWPRFASIWATPESCSEAEERWRASLAWRAETGMDRVLQQPAPTFHLIKRVYPHAFHKRAKNGAVVVLERCDHLPALAQACYDASVSGTEAGLHSALCHEFLCHRLDPAPLPGGRVLRICDFATLSIWQLLPFVLTFAASIVSVVARNYPQRAAHTFVLNASSTFGLILTLMTKMLAAINPTALEGVHVFTAAQAGEAAAALLELVDSESLPAEYGGSCACEGEGGCWRRAPEEVAFWEHVEALTPLEVRRG